jgi:hypothetical protein
MIKEFTPYQEALELKELGFDEPCFGYYEDNNLTITFPSTSSNGWKWVGNSIIPAKNTKAPLFQQAFRWFREKYQLHSYIEGAYPWFRFYINSEDNRWEGHKHLSHEEAELECLKKLIEIVKNK